MKFLVAAVQFVYPRLYDFWESKRTAYFLSVALVATFGSTVVLALVNASGLVALPGLLGHVRLLSAVEVTFTLLLFFEMTSLVFVIPASIANAIGKQIEILSLVLLRSSFKEFSHYNFQLPMQSQLESVLKMVSDGVGALLVFLLLSVYYGVQRHRAVTPEADREAFVRLKQFVALLVLVALVVTAVYDGYEVLLIGQWVHSVDRFFQLLIFADVLLLLVAFRYTLHYPDIFRYSAFVLVTVFIRFSLLAPVYYNAMMSLFSVLFAIAVVYFHNLFNTGREEYLAQKRSGQPPPPEAPVG